MLLLDWPSSALVQIKEKPESYGHADQAALPLTSFTNEHR